MITDASNKERDQINAMAQEHRAQAGELGSHRVELPDKPYGLASGDEIIFTAQHHQPGKERVENGITGTIIDTSRNQDESRVTIQTNEPEPREIDIDTQQFNDLSLGYAVHAYKSQGMTTEHAQVLIGGWQTDRENAYVSLTRAREQTDIYTSREDLGEEGLDTGAIERLAERMEHSRAEEATISREVAQPAIEQVAERTNEIAEQAVECPAERDLPVEPEPIARDVDNRPEHDPAERDAGDQPERESAERDVDSRVEHEPAEHNPDNQPQPEREPAERDPYIEQAIQEARERQEAWEQGREIDRDRDLGFGIE